MGQRHGVILMLAARGDIDIGISDHSAPYTPPLDRSSYPASELVTLDRYAPACADEYPDVWHRAMFVESGGLIGAGTFGAEIDATLGGTKPTKRHQRDVSQEGLLLEG